MSRRSYKGSSQATMLSAPLNSSDLAATVADGSTLPTGSSAPFVLTLDLGLAGEEKVLVASRTGNNLVLVSRGYDGTTATSHSSGANVRHTISAIDLDEANAHVNSTTSVHGIADTAALLTTAAANAAYKALTASGARAYRSAAYSAPNGSITAIPLDAESFDSGSLHDNSTNPSRITVPAAGRYQVTGNIRWAGSTLGTTRSALIYKNGVSVTDTATYANSPATTVSDVVTCAAGDYLELMSYQDSGVAVALTVGSPNTYFSVIYLGA